MTASKPELRIDGSEFSTLEGFYDQVGLRIIPGAEWGRNLEAFNDILRGGFGTPDEGFVFCWDDHEISKQNLGYDETARQLRKRLERCHPSNIGSVENDLAEALRHEGPTVFDWLIEIIRCHCPGGDEAEDGIELTLR
ncbi:barstar family protein [Bradyrhizobium sp. 930_D9_N1_4]|uniref:barstar family protein n=1 Tax=Bradyrhizobium sp. 930_D9_N1_4 TaxID=3240374 RepID=UPI003F8901F0